MAWGKDLLRRFLSPRDAQEAIAEEQRALSRAAHVDEVDPAFRRAMGQATGPVIGHAAKDPTLAVRFDLGALAGQDHALVLGMTNSGKTRMTAAMIDSCLARLVADPFAPRPWVLDHKGNDVAALALASVARIVDRVDRHTAERILDSLVVVNPFSTEGLVPLQILAREPGEVVPEEIQAQEAASLLELLAGAPLGINQDAFVFSLLLLGISRSMTLPELVPLVSDQDALQSAASDCRHPDVRAYFGPGYRPQRSSVAGVLSRLLRILRMPGTRAMVSAKECLNFRRLLRDKIVIVDVGNPPLGAEDLSRFWSGFFTTKITRGVFSRSPDEFSRRVLIVSDEFQEGLLAGPDAAGQYQRVLAMSRVRGAGYVLISQSMAGAAQVSAALPKVIATNTAVQMLFRASIDDARAMSHLLPCTGKRRRPRPLPWEADRGSPFLSRAEELNAAIEEVPTLAQRCFYLWDRRGTPYRAQLVKSVQFDPEPPAFMREATARRIRLGSATIPAAEPDGGAPAFEPTPPGDGQVDLDAALGPPRRRPRDSR